MIREKESLFIDFYSLENIKKIEVMIKIYFFTKELKDQSCKMIDLLKLEKSELIKKHEAALKEKDEKIKQKVILNIYKPYQKVENLRLENECLKNDFSEIKKLNVNFQNEIESLKFKIKELKQRKDDGMKEIENIDHALEDEENNKVY